MKKTKKTKKTKKKKKKIPNSWVAFEFLIRS